MTHACEMCIIHTAELPGRRWLGLSIQFQLFDTTHRRLKVFYRLCEDEEERRKGRLSRDLTLLHDLFECLLEPVGLSRVGVLAVKDPTIIEYPLCVGDKVIDRGVVVVLQFRLHRLQVW